MGAGGVIIILKNIKSALQVGCNRSGSVKLWHVFAVSHVLVYLAGKFF